MTRRAALLLERASGVLSVIEFQQIASNSNNILLADDLLPSRHLGPWLLRQRHAKLILARIRLAIAFDLGFPIYRVVAIGERGTIDLHHQIVCAHRV